MTPVGVTPGDRFTQVWPPSCRPAVLTVESVLDADRAAVLRLNGARQVFPISTLLTTRFWARTP